MVWKNVPRYFQMRMVIRLVFSGMLMLIGLVAFRGTALSATITVDTTVDEPLSDPDNGNCSLREAIQSAKTDSSVNADACVIGSGADTVFIPAGFYLLSDEIVLQSELTLDGEPGTYISGGDATNILRQLSGTLTLQNLTLQNGVSTAGGCFEQGSSSTTTFSTVVLKNCSTTGRGGAIYSTGGDLIILDSLLQNNAATGNLSGNNSGGAIYTTGNLTITRTVFNANSVDLSASPGQGGAIHFLGTTLIVEDSTFERNEAVAGGAIFGNANISGSTFFLNSASNSGGAVFGSSLTVSNSTFSGNDKGGIYSSGTTVITNSTFYANTGAAGIARQAGTTTVMNTLFYAKSGGVNCSNGITSAGHNFDNNNSCGFIGPGDLGGTNPLLGVLDWNGGTTRTHALLAGSLAIDAGTNTGCPAIDQRGFPRPKDGNIDGTADCDIGAYEHKPFELFLPLIMR